MLSDLNRKDRLRQEQKQRTVEEVQEVFLPLTAKNLRTSDKAIANFTLGFRQPD